MTRTLAGLVLLVLLQGTSWGQYGARPVAVTRPAFAPDQAVAPPPATAAPLPAPLPAPAATARTAPVLINPYPPPAPAIIDPRTRAWEQVWASPEGVYPLPLAGDASPPGSAPGQCGCPPSLLERIRNLRKTPSRLLFSHNAHTGEWEMAPEYSNP
jgi:hypothetical protein